MPTSEMLTTDPPKFPEKSVFPGPVNPPDSGNIAAEGGPFVLEAPGVAEDPNLIALDGDVMEAIDAVLANSGAVQLALRIFAQGRGFDTSKVGLLLDLKATLKIRPHP
jgi:hypothetical protein